MFDREDVCECFKTLRKKKEPSEDSPKNSSKKSELERELLVLLESEDYTLDKIRNNTSDNSQINTLIREPNINKKYDVFCRIYIIKLIQNTDFIPDECDSEILLAAYGYLQGYSNLGVMNRRKKYLNEASEFDERLLTTNSDTNSVLQDIEDDIIEALVNRLDLECKKDNADRHFIDRVVDELMVEYPDGLPEKLSLPLPKYEITKIESDSTAIKYISSDGKENTPSSQNQSIEDITDIIDDTGIIAKKSFRIKPYIFGAAAVMVVLAGIAIFSVIMAQFNGNVVPDQDADSADYVIDLSSYDNNISDSSSLTPESSGSEEISASTNIPNLAIESPEGLSQEVKGDGRSTYTMYQIERGILGDKIVFNSITDSEPIGGDERNFVDAWEKTEVSSVAARKWNNNDITVENGKEYVIRMYVHNNSPLGRDAVATNTKVAFSIPSTSAKQVQVNGFISADNADPDEYWDYVNFNADQAFHLEYVYGSALLENRGIGNNGGVKLGDEIVTQATKGGVLIGYDALDGKIPGCYGYASYVAIRVKAVFDTDYLIDNEVRLIGDERDWSNYVNAEIGDIVEFRISYKNLSNEIQNQVAIKDILPKSLRYIPGTTKFVNAGYSNDIIHSPYGLITDGFLIDDYTPGSNAYIYLRAEVVGDTLAYGKNTLVNWAQGSVGEVTIQDYASVVVNKPFETSELPDADSETTDNDVAAN